MARRPVISIIGNAAAKRNSHAWRLAVDAGRALVDRGFRVAGGGMDGIMEAAFEGARSAERYREGDTIALLPGFDPASANPYADIVIATGLDVGRNMLVANQDGVVAVGGGSGTLCEIAYAWQLRRPIVALEADGWSGRMIEQRLDDRPRLPDGTPDKIFGARTGEEAAEMMARLLPKYTSRFPGRH